MSEMASALQVSTFLPLDKPDGDLPTTQNSPFIGKFLLNKPG